MPKRKQRLVPRRDPARIFDNLEGLRKATAATPAQKKAALKVNRQRLAKVEKRFTIVLDETVDELWHHRIGSTAWYLLLRISRLVFDSHRNPVRLTTEWCRAASISRSEQRWGLAQLEAGGAITVERKRGRCPLVTLLSRPRLP